MAGRQFGSLPTYNGHGVVLDNDPRLANTVQATVNFGTGLPVEDSTAVVTVPATWVTASSVIACSPAAVPTADHDPEDVAIEGVTTYVTNLVPGTSFDIIASAPDGTWGRYLVNAVGA